uniref:Uncharacterized protein n=1 Tax=Ixodes ricinus TaxID=34613 RepID=A0A6B0UKS9_IXORI
MEVRQAKPALTLCLAQAPSHSGEAVCRHVCIQSFASEVSIAKTNLTRAVCSMHAHNIVGMCAYHIAGAKVSTARTALDISQFIHTLAQSSLQVRTMTEMASRLVEYFLTAGFLR